MHFFVNDGGLCYKQIRISGFGMWEGTSNTMLDKDGLKFNDDQRREYLNLTDQVGMTGMDPPAPAGPPAPPAPADTLYIGGGRDL